MLPLSLAANIDDMPDTYLPFLRVTKDGYETVPPVINEYCETEDSPGSDS